MEAVFEAFGGGIRGAWSRHSWGLEAVFKRYATSAKLVKSETLTLVKSETLTLVFTVYCLPFTIKV